MSDGLKLRGKERKRTEILQETAMKAKWDQREREREREREHERERKHKKIKDMWSSKNQTKESKKEKKAKKMLERTRTDALLTSIKASKEITDLKKEHTKKCCEMNES